MASFHMERGAADRAQPCVETALDAAVRAGGLTQRLLGLVRRQAPASHGASVSQVLSSLRELLPRVLGDGIQLEVAVAQDVPPVPCDGGQLEAALLNLAINARDAMSGRGVLRISSVLCTREALVERAVTVGRKVDAYAEIAVSDDGPGMSEHVRLHALEPFFTTKPKGHGTGLGLAMVHDLVTQYGGAIDIQSELGHGTAVRLFLPCGVATAEDDRDGHVVPVPDLAGIRMLVVENDDIIRRTIAARLRQLDCQVYESPSGHDALLTLSTCHALDLLLSDIDLPGLDGYELCREARLIFPSLPVILMTGYADAELLARQSLDNAAETLLKPFDMGALLAKIHVLLGTAH
ncbi:MAG TPA: response regulator [Dyella sp.]